MRAADWDPSKALERGCGRQGACVAARAAGPVYGRAARPAACVGALAPLRQPPIYDLLYVALAERRRVPLLTADTALRERLIGMDFLVAPQVFAP